MPLSNLIDFNQNVFNFMKTVDELICQLFPFPLETIQTKNIHLKSRRLYVRVWIKGVCLELHKRMRKDQRCGSTQEISIDII